jgi:small ligand-binding sensory domain FIST
MTTLGDAVAKAIGEPDHAQAKLQIEMLRSIMNSNADILLAAIQSIVDEIRGAGEISDAFVATLRDEINTEMALRIDRAQSADEKNALQFHRDSILRAIPLIVQRIKSEAAKTAANELGRN